MSELEVTLNLDEKRIVIYDFETDGLEPPNRGGRPIEVAMTIIEPKGVIMYYHSLISRRKADIDKPLKPIITELTGITSEILKEKGKDIKEVFSIINDTVNDRPVVLVGHNIINFDNKYLNFRLNKLGYEEVRGIDCFDTAGQFKGELLGWNKFPNITYNEYHQRALSVRRKGLYFKLAVACEHYGIDSDPTLQHTAEYDVYLTLQVFLKQIKKLGIANDMLMNLSIPSWEELKSSL